MQSRNVDFWSQLTDAERQTIVQVGQRCRYGPGRDLLRQGDATTHLVLVVSGSVKATRSSVTGSETVLAICGPGSILGEVAAMTGGLRSATVTALDHVDAVKISWSMWEAAARQHPRLRLLLESVLAARLLHADNRRADAGTPLAIPRIAALLADLGEQHATARGPVLLPVSQAELASLAATSSSSTARALRTLRANGLVRTMRRMITITDVAELRRHADRLTAG